MAGKEKPQAKSTAKKVAKPAVKPAPKLAAKKPAARPAAPARPAPRAGAAAPEAAALLATSSGLAASQLIDRRIRELRDWRGAMLERMRRLIRSAHPQIVEEVKWAGTPVWSCHGILCTGETYKDVVKLTFAKGASLPDPSRLFNASLDGGVRRAIDLHEQDRVDERAFTDLVRAAVATNLASVRRR